jgi:multiple sugar transport system ATP-binding protein
VVAVRPEDIAISTEPVPGAVEFTAYSVLPSGADSTIIARLGGTEITVRVMGISNVEMDDKIWLKFNPDKINLYDKESGNLVISRQ